MDLSAPTRRGNRRHAVTPALVGFSGDDPASAPKTTATRPIKKYTWRGLTAAPGHTHVYDIIPMVGTPGALTRTKTVLTTNPVTLTRSVPSTCRPSSTAASWPPNTWPRS